MAGTLTSAQKAFYDDNGYVLVKGVLSKDEAATYRQHLHELAERLQKVRNIDATWGAIRQTQSEAQKTVILHCHDVQFYDAVFTRLICDPRLTGIAQSIIGPNVQLHHTKMFIKPPEKGSPFPMHQDAPYFPHDKHSMIAAIIHFDDAPLEKGCVRVMPGSHKLGVLEHERNSSINLPMDKYPIDKATPCPAEAGDVLFFSYLTIHGSGVNTSSEARTTMLVQMRDPTDPPTIRAHESRGQGTMLAGIDPSCCTIKPSSENKPATGAAAAAPTMGTPVMGAKSGM
ncbi:MAG TPA: phytanoyl-CoA dioxygenase family protein [Tepidisphaeraceae bacterium]|jgi:ectoine hydroxylase-related dioxygenase (phytanoyl-CoA dioxygenase family)